MSLSLTIMVAVLVGFTPAGGDDSGGLHTTQKLRNEKLQADVSSEPEFVYSTRPDVQVLHYRSAGTTVFVSELFLYGDGRLVYNRLDARDGETVIDSQETYLSPADVASVLSYCVVSGLVELDGEGLREKYAGQLAQVADGATVYLTLGLDYYEGEMRTEPGPFEHTVVFHAPGAGTEHPELRALIVVGNELIRVFNNEE